MVHRTLNTPPVRLGLMAAIVVVALRVGWYLGSQRFLNLTFGRSLPWPVTPSASSTAAHS
jgi:hypothetical protein